LTINKTGSGYTLKVTSTGLSAATTSAINVTKNGQAATSMTVAAVAAPAAPTSLLSPLLLDTPDFFDTLALKKHRRSL
jgi:hypothetical protein